MKKYLIIYFVMINGFSVHSQTSEVYWDNFMQLCEVENSEGKIDSLLRNWQSDLPKDPELFIAKFNHYLSLGREEIVRLDNSALYSDIQYDQQHFDQAISALNEGIKLYPDRLDMRYGKIYSLGQQENWHEQTESIIKLLDKSKDINFKWKWKWGEPLSDGKERVVSGVQDYLYTMFNTSADLLCNNIITISNKMIELFPKDKFNYSNIGSCYLVKGDFEESLKYLEKAKDIDNQDPLILYNIGYVYMKMKKDEEAINYFNLVKETGHQDYIQYANEMIDKINTK